MKISRFVTYLAIILFAVVSETAVSQSATYTTLTVSSGGVAVTEVPAMTVVTLTATVRAGSTAVQLGTVNFCDAAAKSCTDIHLRGTAQLTKAGTGTVSFRPGIGPHSYKAVFLGTKSNAASASGAAALTVKMSKYPTTTTIAQSGDRQNYTLTATVDGPGAIEPPTGTVSFQDTSDGNSVLDTAMLVKAKQDIGLRNSQTFTTSSFTGVAAGDFNGDGILDLAYADNSTVTFQLGKGNGTFAAKSSIGTSPVGWSIAVADFNGDGILDVADTSAWHDTLNIFLGNGDGTFTVKTREGTGDGPIHFVVADLNRDGILDLAIANWEADYVTILLGNGDGTFTAAPNAPGMPHQGAESLSVGDFNGDGIPDLAFQEQTAWANPVSILLGNGDGTFTAAPSLIGVNYGGYGGIFVADFNSDGKEDLGLWYWTEAREACLKKMLGNGDGTFTEALQRPTILTRVPPDELYPGDFNGDDILDLVLRTNDEIHFLLGKGDGTFSTRVTRKSDPLFNWQPLAAVGDFDGDGISDLVMANYQRAAVWLQTQRATTTAGGISVVGGPAIHKVAAVYSGDANHRGSTSDLVDLDAYIKPTQLVFTTPPAAVLESGVQPGAVKVTLEDSNGVVTAKNGATVELVVTGPNRYSQIYTTATVSGVATFEGLIPLNAIGTYTYTATDTPDGLTPAIALQEVVPRTAVSATPSSGYGITQKFSFVASRSDGAGNLAYVNMMFGTTISRSNTCYLGYVAATNHLNLVSDDGGTSFSGHPGTTGTLRNSQCSIDLATTTVVASAYTLTVSPAITFNSGLTAGVQIYMAAGDVLGKGTGWKKVGWWIVGNIAEGPPSAVSVTPSTDYGTTQHFSFVASSPNGVSNLAYVNMMFGSTVTRSGSCYLGYTVADDHLYLVSDDGRTKTSGQAGTTGTLSNSQCSIDLSATTVTKSGDMLTVAPTITFNPSFTAGVHIYMAVGDVLGMGTGWKQMSP
jgi:hypothetical protein